MKPDETSTGRCYRILGSVFDTSDAGETWASNGGLKSAAG
jgi:hypothetical protein